MPLHRGLWLVSLWDWDRRDAEEGLGCFGACVGIGGAGNFYRVLLSGKLWKWCSSAQGSAADAAQGWQVFSSYGEVASRLTFAAGQL